MAGLGPFFWPLLTIYALHFIWQARALRVEDGSLALKLFKSNRDAGLILFLGMIAGSWRLGLLG